jgi:hypothetical protein
MRTKLNKLLDFLSNYLAARKGLLPLIGIGLVMLNFMIQFFLDGWIVDSNLFLHLGIVLAIFGVLLSRAL